MSMFSLLSLVFFTTLNIFAVTGTVLEEADMQPVAGAMVAVVNGTETVYTDAQGNFELIPPSSLHPGGLQTRASLYASANTLYVFLQSKAFIGIEFFDFRGRKTGSASGEVLEKGSHRLDLSGALPAGTGNAVLYLRLRINGKSSLHKVLRLSGGGGPELRVSRASPGPLALKAQGAPAGNLAISIDKLEDTTVAYQTAADNLGDIILRYPPRALDVGALPPYGATVLFAGTGDSAAARQELEDNWQHWVSPCRVGQDLGPTPIVWEIMRDPEDVSNDNKWSFMSCCSPRQGCPGHGYDDLVTKQAFGDHQVHVEFNTMGQYDDENNANLGESEEYGAPGYTNSGVYVQNRYEIQIMSSDNPDDILEDTHYFASLCDQKTPDVNERRPNGQWQAFDITFRTSRWTDGGDLIDSAFITVYWNGVKVHDNVLGNAPATGDNSGEEHSPETFGLKLQSEGLDCRYRNIWVKEYTIDERETDFGY
ncbi:family 16 glycoside hydrolase [Fibrobacterota bacterium]